MATLIQNARSQEECTPENKSLNTRQEVPDADVDAINQMIAAFADAIAANPDAQIRGLFTATTFPVADIQAIISGNAGCEYLRVYNGFDSKGAHHTFMAPVDGGFRSFPRDVIIVRESCCPCKPCRI